MSIQVLEIFLLLNTNFFTVCPVKFTIMESRKRHKNIVLAVIRPTYKHIHIHAKQ
jgi:hypothetical protein